MDAQKSASHAPLVWILLTAAVLQAVIIARAGTISADGIIFTSIARDLPRGLAEAFHENDQHPGYPILLLGATRVVQWFGYREDPQAWIVGGLAVSYVCGLLSVWVVWLFARDLFDTRVANMAALIFAVLPLPRGSVADAQSDTPHLLAYMLAAWLASSAIVSGSLLRLAAAGIASGIAYWIRPEGLEVLLVALACLTWRALRAQWSWRRVGLAWSALATTALVVAAPYPILAGKITSKQLPFAKAYSTTTYIEQMASTPAPPTQAPAAENAPDVTQVDPVQAVPTPAAPTPAAPTSAAQKRYTVSLVLKLLSSALQTFLSSICQGFKFIFIPFYLIGHVELIRRKPDALQIALIALLGVTHILILLGVYILSGYIAHRHVLPLVALAMPFTALGVVYVGGLVARWSKTEAVYPTLAILALSCALVLPYTLRQVNLEFVPVIEATQWVQTHAEPDVGIVCNSPYVQFYGTHPVTYFGPQVSTVDDVLALAPTNIRFDYVVLHVNAFGYRPEWIDQLAPYYRQVQVFSDPHADAKRPKKVLVFQAKEGQVRRPAHRSPS